MAVKLGFNAKLYLGEGVAWHPIDSIRSLTLSIELGEVDVTSRASNGWRTAAATIKCARIEFDMAWNTEDAGFVAIKDALFNGTPLHLSVLDGDIEEAGTEGLRGWFKGVALTRNEALEEAIAVVFTMTSETPSWITIT